MDSFIVSVWRWILERLKYLSPYHWICKMFPRLQTSYGFVDGWVLGNTVLCLVLLTVSNGVGMASPFLQIVFFYGGLRVLEIVVVNATILLFRTPSNKDLAETYALCGYRRLVVLVLHNYAEVVLWFGIFYFVLGIHFTSNTCELVKDSWCAAYFSLVTMATVGYGDIYPKDHIGHMLVSTHISIAIFLTLIILTRVVAYLPQPASQDPYDIQKVPNSANERTTSSKLEVDKQT